jgi:hypothetical protein
MRRLHRSLLALTAAALSTTGCASIMHGTSQNVGLSSSPTAATVTVDGFPLGTTPVIAKLSRKKDHIVRFDLAGYQPFEATLTKKTSGWVWGNIVFGGLIGLVVDAASGGMYNLTPEQLAATMPAAQVGNPSGDGLHISVVLSADPSWQKVGQLERATIIGQ